MGAVALEIDHADGLAPPRRYWSMAAISFAIALTAVDTSVANIALPTLSSELGIRAFESVWIVSSYQLAILMTLLPFAALGEVLSYRRANLAGMILFVGASIGCALASNLMGLVIARFVQGIGASAVMATNGALVRLTHPRSVLGRAIGFNAMVVAVSAAAGPSLAASILTVASWRWLFLINIPLGLIPIVVGWRAWPSEKGGANRIDLFAVALNAVLFSMLFFVTNDLSNGRASRTTMVALAGGLTSAGWLYYRERHSATPLIPLDLLRVPILRLSYATSSLSFSCYTVLSVSLPFFLSSHFGLTPLATGFLITPLPVALAATAPVAGRLVNRFHAGWLGGAGLLILGLGSAVIAVSAQKVGVGVGAALCGIGFGLFHSPNNRILLGDVPRARAGAATGLLAVARLLGQLAGAVLAAYLLRAFGQNSTAPFVTGALLAGAGAVISLSRVSIRH